MLNWFYLSILCTLFISIFTLSYKYFSYCNKNDNKKILTCILLVFICCGFLGLIGLFCLYNKYKNKIFTDLPYKVIILASVFLITAHTTYTFIFKTAPNPGVAGSILNLNVIIVTFLSFFFFFKN